MRRRRVLSAVKIKVPLTILNGQIEKNVSVVADNLKMSNTGHGDISVDHLYDA